MTDDLTRRAAMTSAFVAVPVALVVGLVVFFSLHGRVSAQASAKPTPAPSATSTAPITMPAPKLAAADAQMCLAFIAALPTSVRGSQERRVTAGPEQNAAFGDPAITAQCGAPKATVAPTDDVYPMNSVCWHEQKADSTTVWTTLDRPVPIAITIPDSYTDPGQWANEFSGAIVQAMPEIKTPFNC